MNIPNLILEQILNYIRNPNIYGLTLQQVTKTLETQGMTLDKLALYRFIELESKDTDWDYVENLNQVIDFLQK